MASKTMLVAQREYLENVRTKTFWLGILAVPVLIIISLGAGWVLNKLKEVKTYAVIDYSEPAIGRRVEMTARQGDLRAFQKAMSKAGKVFAALPEGDLPDGPDTDKLYQAWLEMPATDMQAMLEASKGFNTAKKYELKRLSELELDHLERPEQEKALAQLVEEEKLFAFFTLGKNPTEDLEGFNYISNNLTDNDLRDWYAAATTRVVQSLRIRNAKIPRDVAQRLQEMVHFRDQRIT